MFSPSSVVILNELIHHKDRNNESYFKKKSFRQHFILRLKKKCMGITGYFRGFGSIPNLAVSHVTKKQY